MITKTATLSAILIFISTTIYAQTPDSTYNGSRPWKRKDIGLIAGIHQFKNTFIELGIAKTVSGGNGCAFGSYFNGTSLSAEYNPFQKKTGIMLTRWTSSPFFTLGINISSYTDFNNYNLGIKPF